MNQVFLTKGKIFILAGLLISLAAINSGTVLAGSQEANDFDASSGFEFAVLSNGEVIKKSAELNFSFDQFIFPVLLIGSGKCKATVSLSGGKKTELVGVLCAGVSCGPYTVIDYNLAPGDHSASTMVTIEEYGLVFVVATAFLNASEDTRTLTLNISF